MSLEEISKKSEKLTTELQFAKKRGDSVAVDNLKTELYKLSLDAKIIEGNNVTGFPA